MPTLESLPVFLPHVQIFPCGDHEGITWSMWVLFVESMSWREQNIMSPHQCVQSSSSLGDSPWLPAVWLFPGPPHPGVPWDSESTDPAARLPATGPAERRKALWSQVMLFRLTWIQHTQSPISDAGTERPPHTPCSCVASPNQGPGAGQIQSWTEVIPTCPVSEGLL